MIALVFDQLATGKGLLQSSLEVGALDAPAPEFLHQLFIGGAVVRQLGDIGHEEVIRKRTALETGLMRCLPDVRFRFAFSQPPV